MISTVAHEMLLVAIAFMILGSRYCVAAQTPFTVFNNCGQTVSVGTQPNYKKPILANGGFTLAQGHSFTVTAPPNWGGRFWGRTGCRFDSSGAGSCLTGDCAHGLHCNGAGGKPPITLAEITLGSTDSYDISLVDGFNLPLRIAPSGGRGTCRTGDCTSNVNNVCPRELQVVNGGKVVACQSACEKFNTDQICCRGIYMSPSTCKPTDYSRIFKKACPNAFSYAHDDGADYGCSGPSGYTITFCP